MVKRGSNLHILIIVWWAGAATAGLALLDPVYSQYLVIGTVGWLVIVIATGLIMYEIRRIRQEDKKKQQRESLPE